MKADTGTEQALQQWKALYLEKVVAEHQVELARSVVIGEFAKHGVEFFNSSVGTIAMQNRGPKVVTNWEALARSLLPSKTIERHVERFTSCDGGGQVLAAPSSWKVEAGLN